MEDLSNIKWLGHASFQFEDKTTGKKIYYVDPFELTQMSLAKADLIFITHAHHDHCSWEDVQKLLKNSTNVIAPKDCLEAIEVPENQKKGVVPNHKYTVQGYEFETVPAYNTHPGKLSYHPKENNWVGYILPIGEKTIYHAGDTDFIPEMNEFKKYNIDIALLPIGGTYTMDVQEAIKAAQAIGAKVTIPIHYKRLVGDKLEHVEQQFKDGVTNSKVVILEEFK